MKMLLTRPAAQSVRFAAEVQARFGAGVEILTSPLLDIVETPGAAALTDPATFNRVAALAFTSENAVAVFARNQRARHWPAYCVGPRTASAAAAIGLQVVTGPGTAAGLTDLILSAPPQGEVLHPCGAHLAADLAGDLQAKGVPARALVVYDQVEQMLSATARAALAGTAPILVPVFSPRTARLLAPELHSATADLRLAAISPAVAEALGVQSGARMEVARTPRADAVLDALERLAKQV